jgi:hypothetical protein
MTSSPSFILPGHPGHYKYKGTYLPDVPILKSQYLRGLIEDLTAVELNFYFSPKPTQKNIYIYTT